MRQADKDKYFNNIEINPVNAETQRQIEFIILEKEREKKNGIENTENKGV